MYTYGGFMLMYSRGKQNIAKQLFSNKFFKDVIIIAQADDEDIDQNGSGGNDYICTIYSSHQDTLMLGIWS